MKKATFYLCMNDGVKISTIKVKGYSEGDIGLHKSCIGWQATHIPTGCLCQGPDPHKTKKAALEYTLRATAESAGFEQLVQKRLGSANHTAFLEAKKL